MNTELKWAIDVVKGLGTSSSVEDLIKQAEQLLAWVNGRRVDPEVVTDYPRKKLIGRFGIPVENPKHKTQGDLDLYLRNSGIPHKIIDFSELQSFTKTLSLKTNTGEIPFRFDMVSTRLFSLWTTSVRSLALHARGLGASTHAVVYALYYAVRYPGSTILVLANKLAQARELVKKIFEIARSNESITVDESKGNVGKSLIVARAATPDAVRGLNVDLVLFDQPAHVHYETFKKTYSSLDLPPERTQVIMYGGTTTTDHPVYDLQSREIMPTLLLPWSVASDRDLVQYYKNKRLYGDSFENAMNCVWQQQ